MDLACVFACACISCRGCSCLADLEWKLIYVGSAYDPDKDQELESILVGPIPVGLNKIVFQVPTRAFPHSTQTSHGTQTAMAHNTHGKHSKHDKHAHSYTRTQPIAGLPLTPTSLVYHRASHNASGRRRGESDTGAAFLSHVQTDAPNITLIDTKDLLGPTVVLLTCSYKEQEFIRIG